MKHSEKKTSAALLAAAILISCLSVTSCEKKENDPETADTVNAAYETLAPEEYALYSIAGAESAYPDIPAVLTFVRPDGKEIPVTYDEFRYYQLNYKAYFDNGDESYWTTNPDMVSRAKGLAVDEIMRNHAVIAACEDYGITISEDERFQNDRSTAELAAQFGSLEYFDQALESYYMTEYFYNYQVELETLYDRLNTYYKDTRMILTEDADIRAMLNTDDFVRAKHILIKNDAGDDRAANLAQAQGLLDRLNAGEDFDALMLEYSEDPGMETSPEGYYFFRGEMVEAFENAAFALAEGEISGIVETEYGYHIIKRLKKENTYMDENFASIKDDYLNLRNYQLLDGASAGWEIRYCADFDTYDDWNYALSHSAVTGAKG